MSEALLPYYEQELLFIRQMAQEFGKKYPNAASRLILEQGRSADPHVERLIESFAILAARVHHKLDDDFPQLTDAMLSVLYPHYLAPIPSMSIVQFELDAARGQLPMGFTIARGSRLRTPPVGDMPCRYRTGYDTTLWPIGLTRARYQPPPFSGLKPPPGTVAALRLEFECLAEMQFADLTLDKLRLYLNGENQLIANLHEVLFNQVLQMVIRPLDKDSTQPPIVFDKDQSSQRISPVGYERNEGLLPYPNQSFLGYRLLTEFFVFPNKFLFVDLGGWPEIRAAKFPRKLEFIFFVAKTLPSLEQGVDAQAFRPGCTPVINLFEQTAEPIPVRQTRHEYKIVPDVAHPNGLEIYSVDAVTSTDPTTNQLTDYQPFYSFRHGQNRENARHFWHTSRRQSLAEKDRGTDVYLSLVDLDFHPSHPAESVLVLHTTCSNRDLPNQLQHAGEDLSFDLEMAAPLNRIRCLRIPTQTIRPPLQKGAYWRLLSHLSLNHLSIADGQEGRDALQEILRLYDFSDPESGQQSASVTRQLIEGIVSVKSRRVVGRTAGATASGFCRGIEIAMEFDEQKYVGTGVYLFASVLERFLALYASINSFSQLVAKTKQGEGYLKRWPPRAGDLQLL